MSLIRTLYITGWSKFDIENRGSCVSRATKGVYSALGRNLPTSPVGKYTDFSVLLYPATNLILSHGGGAYVQSDQEDLADRLILPILKSYRCFGRRCWVGRLSLTDFQCFLGAWNSVRRYIGRLFSLRRSVIRKLCQTFGTDLLRISVLLLSIVG